MKAPLWSIKGVDAAKGLFTSVLSSFAISLYGVINAGGWPSHEDWQVTLKVAAGSFLGYILKNFVTGENNKILTNK